MSQPLKTVRLMRQKVEERVDVTVVSLHQWAKSRTHYRTCSKINVTRQRTPCPSTSNSCNGQQSPQRTPKSPFSFRNIAVFFAGTGGSEKSKKLTNKNLEYLPSNNGQEKLQDCTACTSGCGCNLLYLLHQRFRVHWPVVWPLVVTWPYERRRFHRYCCHVRPQLCCCYFHRSRSRPCLFRSWYRGYW